MLNKLFTIYVFLETLICGCGPDKKKSSFQVHYRDYVISEAGKMDVTEVPESSGLELSTDSNFWTHGDSGNKPSLYKVNAAGKLLQTLEIPNTQNEDWEDLAKDNAGNIYIGDFGNNGNRRRNLRIFRINENNVNQVDTIRFSFSDQKEYPPAKDKQNFDCEAFFYHQNNLYLFSKNRDKSKMVKVYKVPAKPGTYQAALIDSIQISNMITAADINPSGNRMALLGYGNIYLFDILGEENFFGGSKYCIPVKKTGQAEALVFINNTDFIFSNEAGKIYNAVKKEK